MADNPSRGEDIRNYIPAFKKGAKVPSENLSAKSVTSAKIGAAFLSGTLVSGRITVAIAHGLGVKPKSIVVCPIVTGARGASAVAVNVYVAAASAANATNFYLIGSQKTNEALKYAAYIQI